MNYDKIRETIYGLILGTIVCIMISMCTSCKHTEYVPVPEYHDVYIHDTDTLLQKDSVYIHDSIMCYTHGDSVYVNKYHTKYIDRLVYKNTTDTVLKTDTLRVPYPVEKPISALHKFTYDMGILALLILAIAAIACIARKILNV